jgi:CBS domain-containing protein
VSHAFDGAVSFHFNTGAIGRASCVGAYNAWNWPQVSASFLSEGPDKGLASQNCAALGLCTESRRLPETGVQSSVIEDGGHLESWGIASRGVTQAKSGVMSSPAVTVTPETSREDCFKSLVESRNRHVPVVDQAGGRSGWQVLRHGLPSRYRAARPVA